jgi:hypothetical protein
MIGDTERNLTGDKLQQDVRNWLSPPDPWKNHNLARGSRHSGTGTWWIEGDDLCGMEVFWCKFTLMDPWKTSVFRSIFFPATDDYFLCSGCGKERHLV